MDSWDQWFDVVHYVGPNPTFKPQYAPFSKKFISIYFQKDRAAGESNKTLKMGGFNEKPFLAPRWDVKGVNIYGEGPGHITLGDVKMLQKMQTKSNIAIDKMVDPPMVVPSSMRNEGVETFPGAVIYQDPTSAAGNQVYPALNVNFNISATEQKIELTQMRVKRMFYLDLFRSVSEADKTMTATEVAERKQERLLMLGAVVERLQHELLDPLIDRVFSILLEHDLLPEIPEVLSEQELKIEYLSLLAQSQKSVGVQSMDSFIATVGNMAQLYPGALDKVDFDEVIDEYADGLGVVPKILKSEIEVEKIRNNRAKMQQMQENLAMIEQGTEVTKNLSQSKNDEGNMLADMKEATQNG
jgi:hypothetical protein